MKKSTSTHKTGISFKRLFTSPEQSAYDMFKYEHRSSTIRTPTGDVVAEIKKVEVPTGWSQIATDILAQKYLRKAGVPQADGSTGSETSVKQVVHRLANCWQQWGKRYNYFKTEEDAQIFYDELVYMLLGQYAAPNSPQWFNTGLYESYNLKGKAQGHYYVDPATGKVVQAKSAYERPQPHACFILAVKDDLVNKGGIMDLWVQEAKIFKYGSGVGSNFSNIRGKDEALAGGGTSSGLMSFLKIGDRAAGAIKSGGTTRRAAKMVSLDLDHPEVVEFINWKKDEEKKVAALIAAGYSADYNGEAYQTISGQNSNNSVRVPNSFFKALHTNGDWNLTARTDGHVVKTIPARALWQQIAEAAWACADPGLQFDTTINEWHTCPAEGPIRASNPCSEYMFLDNTACNLASLNLTKFYDPEKQEFNVAAYEHACRLWTVVLDISVQMAQFPSEDVAQRSYDYRTIGLGYANLGALLMIQGVPYDSEKARTMASALSAIMTGAAYRTSAELAAALGAFPKYNLNKEAMLRVIRNHRYAAHNTPEKYENLPIKPEPLSPELCPDYLHTAARKAWDEALSMGEKYGYRNAQATVIAPTGTIGLLMDCDTTGVEPDFALVKYKKLAGGGYFKIINHSIPLALEKLGYQQDQLQSIVSYAKGHATLQGCPHITPAALQMLGFTKEEVATLESSLPAAYNLASVFSIYTFGEACLQRLGFSPAQYQQPDFNLLQELDFTEQQLEEANDYVCGTMTLEGAPYLKQEHYPVFDCANRCGSKGTRFIHADGHIRMMAAVQPFISGAISKTINLPNETTVEEVARCYELSWELGLKACSLYRDGSKLSQPLSSGSSKKEEKKPKEPSENPDAEQVLKAAQAILANSASETFRQQLSHMVERRKLPDKRNGFTQKAKIDGHTVYIRTGEYTDGTLGEVFIDMYKEGASFRSILNCFAIAVSLGLQYGVPLEEFVNRFTFTRFEPAGRVEHPNIKSATSVFDYLFRMLGYEYLNRTDLVHVQREETEAPKEEPQTLPVLPGKEETAPATNGKAYKVVTQSRTLLMEQTQQVLATMMGDAPICNVCGHITIRSGTCYKCLNCGNSLGCS